MVRTNCFVVLLIFIDINSMTQSLECIYCPAHSTEEECKEMNMTQICINETKCGIARFVEKRKDLGQLYPEDSDKELFSVTVKKGCMDEDYCTKIEEDKNSSLNSTECMFCEEDLCVLQFPILCVECDEAVDENCLIQTEPIVKCPPGEVCYSQRIQVANYTHKRGCIESSQCRKQDFCEFCETDICWPSPIPSPLHQRQQEQPVPGKNLTVRSGRRLFNHSDISRFDLRLIVILSMILLNM